jgi:hypothetical protein
MLITGQVTWDFERRQPKALQIPYDSKPFLNRRTSRTTFEVASTSGVEHDSTGPLLVLDQGAVTALDSSNE